MEKYIDLTFKSGIKEDEMRELLNKPGFYRIPLKNYRGIGTPIFNSIITNNGWRFGFVVMGIVLLVITLPAAIFPYSFDPSYDNLLPYGNEKRSVIKSSNNSFTLESSILFLFPSK